MTKVQVSDELFDFVDNKVEGKNRHGAIFFHRRKMIGMSCNDYKRHAEENAIIDFYDKDFKGKISIFVFRIGSGKLLNSKPCADCISMMRRFGIDTVYYTDDKGEVVKADVNNLNNNPSKGRRRKYQEN